LWNFTIEKETTMTILKFIIANWDNIAVLVVFAVAVIVLVCKKQWAVLDKLLFAAVTWAERTYGAGTGKLKLAEAMQRIYPHIPAIIRAFVTEKWIEDKLNAALEKAKEAWAANPALLSGNGGT
jgi:hypothetical protein